MTASSRDPVRSLGPRLVLLAAGASSRLGYPKALAPLPQGTPLERLLRASAGLLERRPIVVTGAHHRELAALATEGVELLENVAWAQGRSGSLQLAIRHAPGEDLLVAPVDCPRVPRAVFAALLDAWRSHNEPAEGWLAPFVWETAGSKKSFGHPILIGRTSALRLLQFPPDTPLRTLRGLCTPCLGVHVHQSEILEDLDTQEDFRRLASQDQERL